MELSESNESKRRWFLMAFVTVLVGVASGLAGMSLGLLLRFVQHLAYDYSLHTLVGGESFLQGVSAASPLRRSSVLCVCGAVAGLGWWSLFRFGKPLVSISKAVQQDGPGMPFLSTVVHDLLQIVTVGLGSPLGREVAPRELGALFATRLSERAGLGPEYTRIMIACGAGAGLAAVYNVPLGGALFTLEVLLQSFEFSAAVPAIATSVIATGIAWLGLGNAPQYLLPPLAISRSLIVWSILMGPVFGLLAYLFVRATRAAQGYAPKDWRLAAWCAAIFPAIGLLATVFPQLLGNGKSIAQAGFENDIALRLAAVLLLLRVIVILGALRAGASGGLLTPGLSLGGLLGIVLGSFSHSGAPASSLAGFAVVGSAAFLASSMKMPLTAILLVFEFTRVGHDFLIPISLAVVGSYSVFQLCMQHLALPGRKPVNDGVAQLKPITLPAESS